MDEINFHIRGISPLITNNPQTADPLNSWAKLIKELSSKTKKTDADHIEMGRREWYSGLYLTEDGAPCVPGANLERMIRDSAAKQKQGKNVLAGLIVPDDAPIIFKGPKDIDALWAAEKHSLRVTMGQQRVRIVRTRPYWRAWELKFSVIIDETVLSPSLVPDMVVLAGRVIGLCDQRPRFGRFEVI